MAWALNNTAGAGSGGGSVTTNAFLNPLTPGSVIVAQIWVGPTIDPTSVTDLAGNTYILLPKGFAEYQPVVAFCRVFLYYALNASNIPNNTITVNCANPFAVSVAELNPPFGNFCAGVDANDASVEPVSTGTVTTSPLITTSHAGNVLVGVLGASPGTFTAFSGSIQIDNGVGGQASFIYQGSGAPGPYNLAWAGPAGSPYGAVIISFFFSPFPSAIIVNKVTHPTGSPTVFGFLPSYGPSFSLSDGQSNNSGPLAPGTYSIVETPVPGWSTVPSQDPTNIVLGPGQTLTISFTNTQTGTITVAKTVLPADSSQPFGFTSTAFPNPFSLRGGQSNTSAQLVPGTYAVTETMVPGWVTTTDLDPTAIVLAPGQNVTINFTNKALPHIFVSKVTQPPLAADVFEFHTNYGPDFQLTDGQQNDSGVLAPGTYEVTEDPVFGYNTTTNLDPANIVVDNGVIVNLVFTNSQSGLLAVKSIQELPVQDSLALDSNVPDWENTLGTPYTSDESLPALPAINLSYQPEDVGQVDLIYTPVPNPLSNSGLPLSFPPDFAVPILYRAAQILFSLQGEGADDQRARYCGERYMMLVQLTKAFMFMPNMQGIQKQ